MIERVGVVIPAHNEEALLARCLDSVLRATAVLDIPARVVIVLDRCTDRSRTIAQQHRAVQTVDVIAGNVGVARAAGAQAVLRWSRGTVAPAVWIATTDADTVVPVGWLRRQVQFAASGWEAFVGTVTVADWTEHPAHVSGAWSSSYRPVDDHPHVHGANFGCTAAAYLRAGGWPPLAADEDVALLSAMSDRRVLRSAANAVVTSSRRAARAPRGFATTLREIAG
jgi:glycosyltransferase involved in cell wall biosynthesis